MPDTKQPPAKAAAAAAAAATAASKPGQAAAAKPISPAMQALEVLQKLIDDIFRQIAMATKTCQQTGLRPEDLPALKQTIPLRVEQLHDRLDFLENELTIAKYVLRRDLALAQTAAKERAEADAKIKVDKKEEAPKAPAPAIPTSTPSASAPSLTKKDIGSLDSQTPTTQLTTSNDATTTTAATQDVEMSSVFDVPDSPDDDIPMSQRFNTKKAAAAGANTNTNTTTTTTTSSSGTNVATTQDTLLLTHPKTHLNTTQTATQSSDTSPIAAAPDTQATAPPSTSPNNDNNTDEANDNNDDLDFDAIFGESTAATEAGGDFPPADELDLHPSNPTDTLLQGLESYANVLSSTGNAGGGAASGNTTMPGNATTGPNMGGVSNTATVGGESRFDDLFDIGNLDDLDPGNTAAGAPGDAGDVDLSIFDEVYE